MDHPVQQAGVVVVYCEDLCDGPSLIFKGCVFIRDQQVPRRFDIALGHVPHLQINLSCPGEPISAREALDTALTVEEAALEGYQELLGRVEGDVPLEEFIRSQIATESEHVAQLKELLTE